MLTELHVEHLGVIERLHLVLGEGLIALTGETGAGKTMLVDAIELLVGGRADATMVRSGADEARVDGRFVVPGPDGEREVVLTRVVPADGRSRAYVDGRLATVGSLAELGRRLVDLHGQHAHQSLLSAGTQRAALDHFGAVDLGPLRAARARLTEIDAELAALGGDERARAREIDLLRYQVDELERVAITDADEDARLAEEEAVLADAVAHREAASAALVALTDEGGGRDALAEALAALGARAPFSAIAERLHGVLADLDDLGAELRDAADGIEEDPDRLEQLRDRRQALRDLCRKYGDDLAEVIAFHDEARHRLHELERFDERAAQLDVERRRAAEAVDAAAHDVGLARRAAAPRLAAAVRDRLRDLALPDAAVDIEVDTDTDLAGDAVRFLFAANPGSPLLPLTKVASGGELARTMLALRLALVAGDPRAQHRAEGDRDPDGDRGPERDTGDDAIGTLVFDEVDAGIGGAAAIAVGRALADLGRHHQVLVVTHLPQVAALASTQVVVDKRVEAGTTSARARPVTGEVRVAELARMLSGDDGEVARRHATELLDGGRR